MNKLFLILILIICQSTFADDVLSKDKSLNWQKMRLEEVLKKQVSEALVSILSKDDFKAGVFVTLARTSGKVSKRNTNDKIVISKEEFSPLAKFELDFKLDKLLEPEEIKVDLFKSITRIQTTILPLRQFTENENKEVKALVNKLIKQIVGKPSTVVINKLSQSIIDKDKLAEGKAGDLDGNPVELTMAEKLFNYFKEFNIFAGIIIATLLFVSLGRFIFSGMSKQFEQISAAIEAASSNAAATAAAEGGGVVVSESFDHVDSGTDSGSGSSSSSGSGSGEGSGGHNIVTHDLSHYHDIASFEERCFNSPEETSLLIKKLINKNGKRDSNLLRSLLYAFKPDSLEKVFGFLDKQLKDSWQKIANNDVELDFDDANAYLKKEIIFELMRSDEEANKELETRIYTLSVDDIINVASNDIELGCYLIKYLDPNTTAKVFDKMQSEQLNQFKSRMMSKTIEKSPENDEKLLELITKAENDLLGLKPPPMIQSLIDQIHVLSRDKEKFLLETIAELGNIELLEEITYKYYPSELLFKLGDDCLRPILMSWNVNKRLIFLYNLDDSLKTKFLESIGSNATKVRQLIDIELSELEANEERKQDAIEQKDSIKDDYVRFARKVFLQNTKIWNIANKARRDWIHTFNTVPDSIEGELKSEAS